MNKKINDLIDAPESDEFAFGANRAERKYSRGFKGKPFGMGKHLRNCTRCNSYIERDYKEPVALCYRCRNPK